MFLGPVTGPWAEIVLARPKILETSWKNWKYLEKIGTNLENFGKYPGKLEPLLGNLKSLIKIWPVFCKERSAKD